MMFMLTLSKRTASSLERLEKEIENNVIFIAFISK